MIAFSKLTQDADGAVIIDELSSSEFLLSTPRVTRTATLDGGAVFDHKGFSESDRTFDIRAIIDEATWNKIWTLHKETTVYVSCKYGFYSGAIRQIRGDNGELDMTVLINEKLST